MAIMLPSIPRECTENSLEEIMFDALKDLPDDYYVFHSFAIVNVADGIIRESETDFVIFNPERGIMCIEAKAGAVKYSNAVWQYGSGIQMRHGGPYLQAEMNKYKLIQYIKDKGLESLLQKCKITHCVWFPSISEEYLNTIDFPSEGAKEITLTSSALNDPKKYIDKVFSYKVNSNYDIKTELEIYDVRKLINMVLCPSFELVPSFKSKLDQTKKAFNRLLREQSRILDFLEEQPSAAISGVAGSGKTMIALEKARRCSDKNEKVLFLCYNKMLCEYIREKCNLADVDVYTIDGFACKLCDIDKSDMTKLSQKIEELYIEGEFPYKHIIVDEGQDFGQDGIQSNNILDMLQMVVTDESIGGSFYIFYDKMQLIQGDSIPHCILDADCKMTLHVNCRNTENIAITSIRPISDKMKSAKILGSVKGETPVIHIDYEEEILINSVNSLIAEYKENGLDDICILTCKTEETSILAKYVESGYYISNKRKIRFTSCRKFKGLEADAVILVDVDKDILIDGNTNLFYVGSSRARYSLAIMAKLSEDECNDVLIKNNKNKNKRPKKALAAFLNAKLL